MLDKLDVVLSEMYLISRVPLHFQLFATETLFLAFQGIMKYETNKDVL